MAREPTLGHLQMVTSRKTPYLLLLPGMAWLAVFFAVPMLFLASTSLQTGSLEQGYVLTWHVQTYVDALTEYYPQFIRSIGYAASATVLGLLIGAEILAPLTGSGLKTG